ncbi:MAG: DUF499 domain-containing protein [Bryobacteraceae bacterium]|nr:DUF499 domain-containing protein [Bryobacteraceae bacterium]MDW8343588.1 DUF499 domain-containing protein [Verrucomicrobiae bacterium]MDW8380475.1 DUF499 domain-containing protein [Bryobacterales bacterium]
MNVMQACKPRKEVLQDKIDDAIFAADFGDLIAGTAPEVYADAKKFFEHTHPAHELRRLIQAIFAELAASRGPGCAIRLSTGFGGGKTHALIAIWHLAKNIDKVSLGTELLPAAGRPKKVTIVGVDAGKAGVPIFATHGRLKVESLWGEIFFQLGGEKALQKLGKADHPEASPEESLIRAIFPKGPVLILIDELAMYMAKLSEAGQGNLLGFLSCLSSVVTKRLQTVLVVTDPADQPVYAKEASKIGENLRHAADKLREIFGRKMTGFDPIGDEAASVIARRLFERIDRDAAEKASATYHALYKRVIQDSSGSLPQVAATPEYAQRIVQCYPFHPRLIDTAQGRLGALGDFQKSRGVLRLFARILRDIWERKEKRDLITAGDINWSNSEIQADLLSRLRRDEFKAVVKSDIEEHAAKLDGNKRGIHTRVASALLLESLPLQPNSGMDTAELTLAVLRPNEAGPEPAEALDRLVGVCWHTYPMPGGRGWQFRYEPNIIKQIEERKGKIPLDDAKSRVRAEAQEYFNGPAFKPANWPTSARQVPESTTLQLALCETEAIAKAVCAYADDTDPKAPIPRRFQNAIIAVTATPAAFHAAVDRAQRLLAAEAIERESANLETGKLIREQIHRIMPELQRQFRIETRRAFDRVVLANGQVYSMEERFQVPEDQLLQKTHGQSCLRRFLEEKHLIYQSEDALDVELFLNQILPGATPLADQPEVYSAKAVYERFLAAPTLRLIPDGSIVRKTILRAVEQGKLVVRLPDGRAYDNAGCVEGPEGRRRRVDGALTTLTLDDTVLITRTESAAGIAWTKVDKAGTGPTPPLPLPPQPSRITETAPDKIIELAGERPLLELHVVAATPAAAAQLLALAQPLGADTLSLSLSVGGNLKDGGTMNFAASDLKPNHPTRPLQIAQTIFNALADGSMYQADLTLNFGAEGRTGLESALQKLFEDAPDGLEYRATFDKPLGAAR